MKFISLNIKYLVFVLYSMEYRLKGICKSLYFVFCLHFTQRSNFIGIGVCISKKRYSVGPCWSSSVYWRATLLPLPRCCVSNGCEKTQKEGNLVWQHFVATDQKLAARYYCNDYLLPTSPLHYKGCTLLFCYVFLYLFCPASIHVQLSPISGHYYKSPYKECEYTLP